MAAKTTAGPTDDARPAKKARHRAPSAKEQQRPRFASTVANMAPPAAHQSRVDISTSTVTVHQSARPPVTSETVQVPNSLPEPSSQPSNLPAEEPPQTEDPPPVLPPQLSHLTKKYNFATMSINTGSKIEQKVRILISHLSRFSFLDREAKPGVVALRARSNVASKLISVVEIAKRDIESKERSGKWYQYSRVSGELKEIPKVKPSKGSKNQAQDDAGKKQGGRTIKDWNFQHRQADAPKDLESGDEDGEEEAFETMADAVAKPGAKDTKLRNIPVLTIYMSRVPVSELRIEFR